MERDVVIKIREALYSDAEGIAGVQVSAWTSAYSGIMPKKYVEAMDIEACTSNWQNALNNPGSGRTIVAEDNGQVVAFSVFGPARDKDVDNQFDAELVALNITPSMWRLGIGSSLLSAVFKETRDDYKALYLWVAKKNYRAIKFYEHHAFTLEGHEKKIECHGNIDEIRYIYRFR